MVSPLVISGYGTLYELGRVRERFAPRRILLVTGRGSYEKCGARAAVERRFSPEEYVRFHDFEANPKIEDGKRGLRLAQEHGTDLILAIGGGSVIDMAKMIKAFLAAPDDCEALVRGERSVPHSDMPLVAVPTTGGSGSEATHFAVVYIGKRKYSLAASCLLPDMVFLDGATLASASPYQKAVNGLDALAQAIEGTWAVGSTEESRECGLRAMRMLMRHLPAIIAGNEPEDLQGVMRAAHLAGKAINISKTTAPHAFSYAFTTYHDVPHGHAVWLTMPEIFAIHLRAAERDITDPRGPANFRKVMGQIVETLGMENEEDPAARLRAFLAELGVQGDMREVGADSAERRRFIAEQVNLQRFANNPVRIGEKEISRIFMI